MNIINFDTPDSNDNKAHHWLLPASIRAVICGPSNCGKTNLMMNLLLSQGTDGESLLNYQKVYIYSTSLGQDKYRFLKEFADSLKTKIGKTIFEFCSSSDTIIPVEQLTKQAAQQRTLFVFDDCMLEKQEPIEKYFSQGRHGNADCFYLCQSFYKIPKRVIRENANLIILFRQDMRNLRQLYDAYVTCDMDFKDFLHFMEHCWNKSDYSFAVLDLTSASDSGRYRCGFDEIYVPK